ncbi:MAG: glutamate synthase [Chloroflexi bacterium]|jgi:glutamate synthase (NADPH/NADH) small chain|nr:glutamate synthase [Chloroflexota bacterium]MBL17159.1 glutamate synthase [Chloroflexota bacterium]MDP6498834.1 glutamate synthase subunit beta [Dehalococcoidia bacterium]MQG55630.1 glutamate synthase subunit beta [SAR202 cluster bacterium]|tara:strand:- start:35813 stop:37273 length:1461 start_codon:yes stop_codon:yes gene_type:complete
MGKPTGFIESGRQPPERRPVADRKGDYREFYQPWGEEKAKEQGSRCMDCAVPFCHMGCPLGNVIPEFNHQVYKGDWQGALETLLSTNNFPEFTGRVCPAPCETSCVLSINSDPVTIEYIEKEIVERGYENGWIKAAPPANRTGKKVAVVGSGPAGLAAAQQLNRAGHLVTVIERAGYIGGLLTLGIPEFKLEKGVVQRRVDLMAEENIIFLTNTNVGVDYPVDRLLAEFDAVCLAIGSTQARDLDVPGRELAGVHLAMDYLAQQNRVLSGEEISGDERIEAEGKRVVILGGGDTGADCLGTAIRQGAEVVHQLELLDEPPEQRPGNNPWPQWPKVLRSSPAHEEGGIRDYSVLTKSFTGSNGKLEKLHAVRVEWKEGVNCGRPSMEEIPGSEFEIETELTLLAMGFLHPEQGGILAQIGVDLDGRGNVAVDGNRMSSVPKVFAAGDAARGQSLVVWAISEGRETARAMDLFLMGETSLPHSLPEHG